MPMLCYKSRGGEKVGIALSYIKNMILDSIIRSRCIGLAMLWRCNPPKLQVIEVTEDMELLGLWNQVIAAGGIGLEKVCLSRCLQYLQAGVADPEMLVAIEVLSFLGLARTDRPVPAGRILPQEDKNSRATPLRSNEGVSGKSGPPARERLLRTRESIWTGRRNP